MANDPDCPVITGIQIHCNIINRLMEINKMKQKKTWLNDEYYY